MKLMVMGYGRHGKDTAAGLLASRWGLSFGSSSEAAAGVVILPALRGVLGYRTAGECYRDRHNFRALWFELIAAYNCRDPARLSRLVLSDNDVYCGIRSVDEFLAARREGLFDFAVWVDASSRLGPEDPDSCTVGPHLADYILDNNGEPGDLAEGVDEMVRFLEK